MADNSNLHSAKAARNDEYYTQYSDIEAEMNAYIEYNKDVFRDKTILCPCDDPEWSNFTKYFAANFERLGLKKLISTSYAKSSGNHQISLFEMNSPIFDQEMHETHGKIFVLERDTNYSGRIDHNDIEFQYLDGDGDFRSPEITKLRDEADVIITNPPFSLFISFLSWIEEANKLFIIVGSKNALTYKEVFPLIKENKIWLGPSFPAGNAYFRIPEGTDHYVDGVYDHGGRHEPLQLMTMRENLKYNKKLIKKLQNDYGILEYPHYDNYDAIEVPVTDAIPSDYDGVMGVPITFLDKFCPEQFEIIWLDGPNIDKWYGKGPSINGKTLYRRIIIRQKAK